MKNTSSSLIVQIFAWVLFCWLITLQGCSNKDEELERALVERIIQHKTDSVQSIDLREIFGTQWKKACLQFPYMTQSDFEKMAGETVHDYKFISDDRYALWVFYSNGNMSRVEIETKVMGYRWDWRGGRCTSYQQPYLYFNVIEGGKEYFLNGKGV